MFLILCNQYSSPPVVVVNEVNSSHGKVVVRGYYTEEMGKQILLVWKFQR